MPNAAVICTGCKVSQFDALALSEALRGAGFSLDPAKAPDLAVLNLCAVTKAAERDAYRLLRKIRREHPGAKVAVLGCLAVHAGDGILERGLADLALARPDILRMKGLLERPESSPASRRGGSGTESAADAEIEIAAEVERRAAEGGDSLPLYPRQTRSRAFFKIQDGCSMSCAFCVVPRLRGPGRGLPLIRVLEGLKSYRERGFQEIVLTGIHLGSWGRGEGGDLSSLLAAVEKELRPRPESFRLRLSSLEPREAKGLLGDFDRYPWLARHLHIPLQSGSGKILRAMNRPYGVEFYRELALSLRERYPDMSLGTDLVAGFPGETEEDFQATLSLLRSLSLSYHHVFPFSERPGTLAFFMEPKIAPEVKKARAGILKAADFRKRSAFLASQAGKKALILAEGRREEKSGLERGLTGNYVKVLIRGPAPLRKGVLYPGLLKTSAAPGFFLEALL
ncbi:MAG: MiaB/RimO family radical SAM methylthiotransferase [Deltaproteobacteria bacterium]|jgi:threonylcarbamoyladenosine tRNA methylthiotransferase MtaB|nr:MiaB/RimO family radical SAM methylthiotransferase [Deltaproteobacteria bacterium]